MTQALVGAVCALLGAGSWSMLRAILRRRHAQWIGDLRPGTQVAGPGRNEVWTVLSTRLSADRGRPPTLSVELVAGAAPREALR
jgi:hypothetical protein